MKPILQILLLTLVGAAVIGCKSTGKTTSPLFAAVRIRGHTPEQIRGATAVVFQQDGFTAVDVHSPEMIFEKQGSRWDRIVYGSWVDDQAVRLRVRVSVAPMSDGAYELRCRALRVQHKGEAGLEEETQLKNRKPYQALLEKVRGQLQSGQAK